MQCRPMGDGTDPASDASGPGSDLQASRKIISSSLVAVKLSRQQMRQENYFTTTI